MEKKCFKCGEVKSVTEFYRHAQMADGRLNKCKECTKQDVRTNRANKVEYYREFDKQRYRNDLGVRKRIREISDAWKEEFPDRHAAHILLNNAVRDGRMVKPDKCEQCGGTGRIHGHHEDYTKPLDVIWVCPPCHKCIHQHI